MVDRGGGAAVILVMRARRGSFKRPGSGFTGGNRKIVIGLVVAALAGGGIAIGTGLSNASTTCDGLDQAIQRNLDFMAEQRANPNAQTEAVLKNRQDVIDLINLQRQQAGCTGQVAAPPAQEEAAPEENAPPAGEEGAEEGGAEEGAQEGAEEGAGEGAEGAQGGAEGAQGGAENGQAGEVVCQGSTVTLSGEAGAPFASSGTHPIGTVLKVTNLDNNKSITVTVETTSGSCILLNNAAFEQVREPGKFLIRRAVIERVG
ncbi:septal ring lytic transglycosylase RlpA family protein [Actinoplanes sp. NBC_00393]|uniref:hypothetical protein n=1 Tax=Actinoplanes sp. NBC_00393 TaxID=2975953 RepID=UPI002E1F6DF1